MHDNENEGRSEESGVRSQESDVAASEGSSTVEEQQAEEFADEMQAEPQNIDGEAGVATTEELAAAEDVGHVEAAPEEPLIVEEHPAREFADEMQAEHQNIDGEAPTEVRSQESEGSELTAEEVAADVNAAAQAAGGPSESLSADEILAPDAGKEQGKWPAEDAELTAMLEAVIYITDEPLTLEQMAAALEQPRDRIKRLLADLVAEWQMPHHGLAIREVAGGYKMATKAEHHDAVRQFVKNLKPPMKLSLPALETLAVIAYKQPVTAPEIMDIRGVQGAGVLKTLIDRRLVAPAGRKNVIGKPILYKTTKEFLVQFGLKDLSELPSVKEFEELARFATSEPDSPPSASSAGDVETVSGPVEPASAEEPKAEHEPMAEKPDPPEPAAE